MCTSWKHQIYNLCCERDYDLSKFFPDGAGALEKRCERFGFHDHNPSPLALVRPFCESVDAWINANPDNVASIHCKAGKVDLFLTVVEHVDHIITDLFFLFH